MMDLRQFVAESLKQILDGVAEAQDYARDKGAWVSGAHSPGSAYGDKASIGPNINTRDVEFDVAVTTTRESGVEGGAGIFVAALGLGYQAQKGSSDIAVSRIRFSVPVIFTKQDGTKA